MNLYLIDGYGFVFRAFHSLPPLTNVHGVPIGAVYGFVNMLYKFLSNMQSDMVAVVLDSGDKNFRHNLYPLYKANRPTPPDELIVQFPEIRKAIKAFNVMTIEQPGFEADDLIAAYALKAEKAGIKTKIISSDKDLMQLVNDNISMLDAMRDKHITRNEVIEKHGVPPERIRDYLSLIGDSSDNIPGVKGVGPKTAVELLNEFDTLKAIYENLDKITNPRRKNLLETNKENAMLSYELVGFDLLAPTTIDFEQLKYSEINKAELIAYCQKHGFRNLITKLEQGTSAIPPKAIIAYELVNIITITELAKSYGKISILKMADKLEISIDSKHFQYKTKAKPQGNLFGDEEGDKLGTLLSGLKEVLQDESILKILFDAKNLISKHRLIINNFADISLMAYATGAGNIDCSCKGLGRYFFQDENAIAAAVFEELYHKLLGMMNEAACFKIYHFLDLPLTNVIAQMEKRGVKIDALYLQNLSKEFTAQIKNIEQKIYRLVGKEFNIGSPKQLGEVLFEHMGIKGGKKSKLGSYSTGHEVLESLSEQGFEIADLMIEWRQLSKLVSTYIDALPKAISPLTKRIHTTLNTTLTSTARLSSTEPNLQNIPIRSEEGLRIRQAFVADDGNVIVSADYSQIELRLLAHLANINELKEAFKNNIDIHTLTASQMFAVPVEQVDSSLRRRAKAINFGIIYGISAFGLAKRLEISRSDAQQYIDFYFKQYPGIKEYMDKSIDFARKNGFVKTVFGRRCYINNINDKNYTLRGFAERAAINAPLQGTASDIIRKAMISILPEFSQYMILQVHDELLFEVPEAKAALLIDHVRSAMSNVVKLDVPLIVEIKSGKNWFLAH